MSHDPAQDRLVEGVLSGEIGAGNASVQARLITDSEFRERLDESLQTQRALDRSGRLAREILRDEAPAHALGEALPGDDRVTPTLRRLAGHPMEPLVERSTPPRLLLVPRLIAAAAVLIAAVGIGVQMGPWGGPAAGPVEPVFLSTRSLIDAPRGGVETFSAFRVSSPIPESEGWRFIVLVHDASNLSGPTIAEGSFQFGEEWSLDPDDLGDVTSIRWRVSLVSESGLEAAGPEEGSAYLLSP